VIEMKQGKRIHTVALRLDDQSFFILSHLAMYERKELASYVYDLVNERLYGLNSKIPKSIDEIDEKRTGFE